jgi:hypothetical protein
MVLHDTYNISLKKRRDATLNFLNYDFLRKCDIQNPTLRMIILYVYDPQGTEKNEKKITIQFRVAQDYSLLFHTKR